MAGDPRDAGVAGYDDLERWLAAGAVDPIPAGVDPAAAETARALTRAARSIEPDPAFAGALLARVMPSGAPSGADAARTARAPDARRGGSGGASARQAVRIAAAAVIVLAGAAIWRHTRDTGAGDASLPGRTGPVAAFTATLAAGTGTASPSSTVAAAARRTPIRPPGTPADGAVAPNPAPDAATYTPTIGAKDGDDRPRDTPTPSATPSPTASATVAPRPTRQRATPDRPTATAPHRPTDPPSVTPAASPRPTETATREPTATATRKPEPTRAASPTASREPTRPPTATHAPEHTRTPEPTEPPRPTGTPPVEPTLAEPTATATRIGRAGIGHTLAGATLPNPSLR